MASRKSKRGTDEEKKLSREAIDSLEHFFQFNHPKYFSRNLRSMVVDWMESNSSGGPIYQEEVLSQLNSFFIVLDLIEDEGTFNSEDYKENWGHQ
jgi:hypothetical protein